MFLEKETGLTSVGSFLSQQRMIKEDFQKQNIKVRNITDCMQTLIAGDSFPY